MINNQGDIPYLLGAGCRVVVSVNSETRSKILIRVQPHPTLRPFTVSN